MSNPAFPDGIDRFTNRLLSTSLRCFWISGLVVHQARKTFTYTPVFLLLEWAVALRFSAAWAPSRVATEGLGGCSTVVKKNSHECYCWAQAVSMMTSYDFEAPLLAFRRNAGGFSFQLEDERKHGTRHTLRWNNSLEKRLTVFRHGTLESCSMTIRDTFPEDAMP